MGVDGLSTDDAGAGPGGQEGLQFVQDRIQARAGAAAIGLVRSTVRNNWAAVTRVTCRCQPARGAALEVVQAQGGLALAVVVLDPPADLGQPDQLGQWRVRGQGGQPVVGGFGLGRRPVGRRTRSAIGARPAGTSRWA